MWQGFGASVPGSRHIAANVPCQDAHDFRIVGENRVIVAVADGLGSAAKAEIGAQLAVSTALDYIEMALTSEPEGWEQLLHNTFRHTRAALEEFAQLKDESVKDYATTLIVAAVMENGVVVGHIGDGGVVALLADDALQTISPPQQGEYANEVAALTSEDALTLLRIAAVTSDNLQGEAVLSDGLQRLAINLSSYVPYAPFFKPFFDVFPLSVETVEVSNALKNFLISDRVCARTDDDKTLVVVGRSR